MSEYLSKEEIKQWRGSLEKITLEEFAARLGKEIEPAKPTNDIVDIVLQGKPVVTNESIGKKTHVERLSSIAERAYEREQQIAPTPFSISRIMNLADNKKEQKVEKSEKKSVKKVESKKVKNTEKTVSQKKTAPKTSVKSSIKDSKKSKPITKKTTAKKSLREEVRIVFKKALTDREQKVFDYFSKNKGQIVYAKDLASLLDLPRDYVYKYIKNLRAKIEGEHLENADKGGFILNI